MAPRHFRLRMSKCSTIEDVDDITLGRRPCFSCVPAIATIGAQTPTAPPLPKAPAPGSLGTNNSEQQLLEVLKKAGAWRHDDVQRVDDGLIQHQCRPSRKPEIGRAHV